MSLRRLGRWTRIALLTLAGLAASAAALDGLPAQAQAELTRKVKTRVAPAYPEIARRMKLAGTVRVFVVVSPNGSVKDSKVVGGNPVLVNAAMDALRKWKFEPANDESVGTVEFKFQPQ